MRGEPLNELVVKFKREEGCFYMLLQPFIGWYVFSMGQDWNETLPFSSVDN